MEEVQIWTLIDQTGLPFDKLMNVYDKDPQAAQKLTDVSRRFDSYKKQHNIPDQALNKIFSKDYKEILGFENYCSRLYKDGSELFINGLLNTENSDKTKWLLQNSQQVIDVVRTGVDIKTIITLNDVPQFIDQLQNIKKEIKTPQSQLSVKSEASSKKAASAQLGK